MSIIVKLSICLVGMGILFLLATLLSARKTWQQVPPELRGRWLVTVYLIGFFLISYTFFDLILISDLAFPVELVTGSVFLGGAIFVFIIMNLSHDTISRIRKIEAESQNIFEYEMLLNSRRTLQTILDAMPFGIVIIGRDKKIHSINAAALALADYDSEEELVGQICNTTLCPAQEGKCPIIDLEEKLDRSERLLVRKDGRRIPIMKTVVPLTIEGEEVLLEAVVDITEHKQAEDQIRLLAYYDSLTNLPNRTLFAELLTRALNLAKRHNKLMAAFFIDLDSFKRINDTLGHSIGDELLQAVAKRLLRSVRSSDYVGRADKDNVVNTVSRLGGDEFIVMLPDINKFHEAGIVAQRILQDLAQPITLNGHDIIVSASIGISLYPNDGENVETLLKNADLAMYQAKNRGKNNFQFYTESMSTTALDRLRLENELRKALERGEFELYYQPKVRVQTREIVGMEALIRWTRPKLGVCSPADFIPLAEETGLILTIGEWVLRAACHQGKLWQAEGLTPLPISINISKRQFEQEQFAETVIEILKRTDLPSQLLELEITESMIMRNPETVIAMLNKLKSHGVLISIDDFGTGYSSLGELRQLPIDALKIDRSFITNVVSNGDDAVITRAIIAMAHSLKLKVIAEGVETEAQLEFLRDLDCDQAQGYLFGKPVSALESSQLLARPKKIA